MISAATRVLAVFALLIVAGVPLRAAGQPFVGSRYLEGPHPDRDVVWARTPTATDRLVIAVSYERNFDHSKSGRGRIRGVCTLFQKNGSIDRVVKLVSMKVRRQAGEYTWAGPVIEGQLRSCELRLKGMPDIPPGGWAELKLGLADRQDPARSPWVQILEVTPASGAKLGDQDEVTVRVIYQNPTTRTLRTGANLIEEMTGFSPGVSTRDSAQSIEPGERREVVHTFRLVKDPTHCKWKIHRVGAGLFDERTGRLYEVYNGRELKTTKPHSYRLNICK